MYFELKTKSIGGLTDDEFFAFCQENRDLQFERNANGEIIIMMPTGGRTGNRNIQIAARLQLWAEQHDTGLAFDSSTGFNLPNGATRSPDAAWVSRERWNKLTEEKKSKFPPLCPGLVIELASESNSVKGLQEKMREYVANGCRLGWLLVPAEEKVLVYRTGQNEEVLSTSGKLSGEDVLPGFELDIHFLK